MKEEELKAKEDELKTKEDRLKAKEDELKAIEDRLKERDELKVKDDNLKAKDERIVKAEYREAMKGDSILSMSIGLALIFTIFTLEFTHKHYYDSYSFLDWGLTLFCYSFFPSCLIIIIFKALWNSGNKNK